MSKWDKYRVAPSDNPGVSKWQKYMVSPIIESGGEEDNWPTYLAKKSANVISELPDIPANLLNLGETIIKGGAGLVAERQKNNPRAKRLDEIKALDTWSKDPNYFREENVDRPSKWIKQGLDKAGIDIEPRTTDGLKNIAGHGLEWAAPGGFLGKFSKAAKGATIGGMLGTLSGSAQELGVDPLVADTTALASQIVTPNPAILLNKFSKSGKIASQEAKVSNLLKDITKEQNLERLKNFNHKNLDVVPVTAEVALNRDISNLHNTYAPNLTGVQGKMASNDEILRKRLNNIGDNLNPTSVEVGEAGRELISKKIDKLEKARMKATIPLYTKLEESTNKYPVKNLENYSERSVSAELGDIEKGLKKHTSLLPDKYRRLAEKSKKELSNLEKEVNNARAQLEKEYPNLNPQAKAQILDQLVPEFNIKVTKINALKEEISNLESGLYNPSHIDKAITEIGNNITQLKRSEKGGNKSLLRHFQNQKKSLEIDLKATPEGLSHRQVYHEHSPEINAINRDKLLKKFVSKDEWNSYRVPTDDLPRNIMQAPRENITNYAKQVKNSDAEKLTKAYVRDMYLGKASENSLPTYDKSNQFLRQKRDKLDAIYSPKELNSFQDINNYLKNRAFVARSNSAFGSATAPKLEMQKKVIDYLGSETIKPLKMAQYVPALPFKQAVSNFLTKPNPNYGLLEQALTNPVYARDLITRQAIPSVKGNYLPSLASILNNHEK